MHKDYQNLEQLTQFEVMQALTNDYYNVYIIEPESNKGSVLKLDGYVIDGIKEVANGFVYDDLLRKYAKNRVYEEDQEFFLEKLLPSSIIPFFTSDQFEFEASYRVIEEDAIHYCSAHYTRVSKAGMPLKIVAGFRNVDSIIVGQTKKIEEGLFKAYNALASAYISMHRIDLINDTFEEIKSASYIRDAQKLNSNSYSGNYRRVMKSVCTAAFVEDVIAFMELETLADRMKGKNRISIEFQGLFSGWCRGSFLREDEDEKGNLWHVILAIETIDESKQRENILRKLAETDALTGIYNRRTGENKIKINIEQGTKGLLCILDCDHFKGINDTYGHIVGDRLIIEIAKCLEKTCRKTDIVMRLGGDEFALFIPGILHEGQARLFWERLIHSLEAIDISDIDDTKISMSAGCSFYLGQNDMDFNKLYKNADDAMYRAKEKKGYWIEFD